MGEMGGDGRRLFSHWSSEGPMTSAYIIIIFLF